MKKKALLIITLIMVISFLSVGPSQAKTILEEQDDGKFEITWIYEADTTAEQVYLVGDMNDWSTSHPDWEMELEDDAWQLTKEMPPGVYEYKVVVDGEWVLDEGADDFVDDGVGGKNSVVRAIVSGWDLNHEILSRPVDSRLTFDLTNRFEHIRERYNLESNLNFALRGDVLEDTSEDAEQLLNYSTSLELKSEVSNLADDRSYELQVSDYALSTNYFADNFTAGLELNTTEQRDSYDYLGLLDTAEEKEHSDLLQQEGNLRQLNYQSQEIFDLDMNAAISNYGGNSTLHYLNAIRDITDELELGSNLMAYTPRDYETGEKIDTAYYNSLFGQYKTETDLEYSSSVRTQLSLVPTGNIDQDIVRINRVAGSWDVEVDLEDIISMDSDWSNLALEDIDRVVLTGEFNNWEENPDSNYQFELEKENDSQWEASRLPSATPDIIGDEGYKILAFDQGGNAYYYPSGLGGELDFKEAKDVDDLELQQFQPAYLIEGDYNLINEQASIFRRKETDDFDLNEYKGQINAGLMGVPYDSYLKFATDNIAQDSEVGYHKAYVDSWYRFFFEPGAEIDQSVRVDASALYKLSRDETEDEVDPLNRGLEASADWNNPITVLDNLYTGFKYDPYLEDQFERETSEVEVAIETTYIPGFDISAGSTQYLDAEVGKYEASIELTPFISQLDYLNTDIVHVRDDISTIERDDEEKQAFTAGKATKFVAETRLINLPMIDNYFDYFTFDLTIDEDGLIDHSSYEDDENYWKNKVNAETHFDLEQLSDWDGITANLMAAQIEDHRVSTKPEEGSEDEQFFLSEYGVFVDWYLVSTFETGYDLPWGVRGDLTLKFDHNRVELSEYEDDALLVELSKRFGEQTNLNLSYNKQDEDNGSNYFQLMTETMF